MTNAQSKLTIKRDYVPYSLLIKQNQNKICHIKRGEYVSLTLTDGDMYGNNRLTPLNHNTVIRTGD